MPVFRKGNMWDAIDNDYPTGAHIPVITTNSYITKDQKLVMGRGAALEARERYQGADSYAGKEILKTVGHLGIYGLLRIVFTPLTLAPHKDKDIPNLIYLFQVKQNFKDKASLDLIGKATRLLTPYAQVNYETTYHLNYPGIGNGGLIKDQVYPLIKDLPQNVHIWELE